MERTIVKTPRHNASAHALVHDQIKRKIFDEKLGSMLQRLLIKRVQNCVPRSILRTTRTFDLLRPVMRRHSTKSALMNSSILGTRKWNPVMF